MLEIAGGSVTGSGHQHRLNVKNNQDAFSWQLGANSQNLACAVVCDGCSAGKHNELGAGLLSYKTVFELSAEREHLEWHNNRSTGLDANLDFTLELVRRHLLRMLSDCVRGRTEDTIMRIKDNFLCTIVGVLISWQEMIIFSIGDGVACLNGEEIKLPEYPNNAPPYLAYELIQDSLKNPTPELYKFKIHAQIPVDEFETCLIGSDGAKDLDVSEFWTEDKYFQNADSVRRRLAKINERKVVDGREKLGPLSDDTTLVVIRKGNH